MALTTFSPFSSHRTKASILASLTPNTNNDNSSKSNIEIRVCVNRTCARQGSRETLLTLSGLAPPEFSVVSCGCLGHCGAGPNLAVLPKGELVGYCSSPAQASKLLSKLCGPGFNPSTNLAALQLRKKGEMELEKGNAAEAVKLLSQAIELKPSGGLHFLYNSRSVAKITMGENGDALSDAKEACKIAPNLYQGYISQGDAFMAMEEWDSAEQAYATALDIDPSIRRSRSFKARIAKLQEKISSINA
ncbi:hypothetical protein LUZ60_012071 [Juncus effusus]|nr:hypothetical protein LUZ60_012071 [Juncus effusus]